nr:MFS transporter [Synechococcus sp. RSCCF101]
MLQLGGFRRLWIGQIFSQLADKFYIVLMVALIAGHWVSGASEAVGSGGALADAAAVMRLDLETRAQVITLLATGIYAANTLPAMLLGSVAGVWADRWPKRSVMVASNGLRALLALPIPLALTPGPVWLGIGWGYWALVLMTLVESTLTQFFAPAEQAAIPLLVPRRQLLAANSVYQATSMAATIAGFALGEPILRLLRVLLAGWGLPGGQFLLLPFCYGCAALCISSIRMQEEPAGPSERSVWREIRDGVQLIRRLPRVRGALLHLVLLYSLLAALYVLAISLASAVPGLGPTRFGTLLAMSGVGMAVGALVVAQTGHLMRRPVLASTGLGVIGWCLMLLAQLRGNLAATLALCGLLGVGASLLAIPAQTTIQEDTPEAMRGKVFGLQNNLINVALSLPLVLAGGIVSRYGLVPVLWILAAIALIAAVLERPWQRC